MLKHLTFFFFLISFNLSAEKFIPSWEKMYRCGNEYDIRWPNPHNYWHQKSSDNSITVKGKHRSMHWSNGVHGQFIYLDFYEEVSWKDYSEDKDDGCYILAAEHAKYYEEKYFLTRKGSPQYIRVEDCPMMKDKLGVYIESGNKKLRIYAVPSKNEEAIYFFVLKDPLGHFDELIRCIHNTGRKD